MLRGRWRRVALAGLLLSLCAGEGVRPAGAYRLFGQSDQSGPFLHRGEEWKDRWNPAVWGPGTTLTVSVPEDPLWEKFQVIRGMDDVRRLVSEAMAQWSGLRTADIRWVLADPSDAGDAAVSVVVRSEAGAPAGSASFTEGYGKGYPETERCEVTVYLGVRDKEFRRLRRVVAHELGHCLGLAHHAAYPNVLIFPFVPERWNSMWGDSGVMGAVGGAVLGDYAPISYTEGTGASLLRPAPGWLETTGAVYGTVLGGEYGEERAAAVVLAARLGPEGRPRDAVTRIANHWGQFLIEGLVPGTYVLTVYSMGFDSPGLRVVPVRQSVRLDPVEVRAGERTGPLVLTARRQGERE